MPVNSGICNYRKKKKELEIQLGLWMFSSFIYFKEVGPKWLCLWFVSYHIFFPSNNLFWPYAYFSCLRFNSKILILGWTLFLLVTVSIFTFDLMLLYASKYQEKHSMHFPDFFLISGASCIKLPRRKFSLKPEPSSMEIANLWQLHVLELLES